ncbi:hypothetical protein Barb6XT_02414 [Bacteroidales bacterium Barb6XT]|nr:hypothetical protein Barb6XT_02414 [Bacteroidales bacterium Barb6XT]
MYEIEQFFGKYVAGKEVFLLFLKFLKTKGNVELDFKQTKIGVNINNSTFSIVRQGGQGGRKSILQINTDFDATSLLDEIQIDDRVRGEGQKKKGSLELERYEMFFRNSEELQVFCDFFKNKM